MQRPSLIKRGKYYHIKYPVGGGKFRTFTTNTKDRSTALGELYKFTSGELKPENQLKPILMSDLANISFATNKKTSDGYKSVINCLVAHTIDKPVHLYTTLDIDTMIDHLHGTRSPYTLKAYIKTLSSIFNKAIGYGYAVKNPVPGHKRFILPPLELDYFSKEQFKHFISFVDKEVYRDLYLFAVLTGMRQGEVLNCKSEHITDRFIYVPVTKTNTPRTVDLPDILRPIVAKYSNQEYLFRLKKEKLNNYTVQQSTRKWLRLAGLNGLSFHSLRKTFGKWLLDEGVAIEFISKQLGHKNITITLQHYARYLNNEYKGFVNRIAL